MSEADVGIWLGLGVLVAFIGYSVLSQAISKTLLTLPIIFTFVGFSMSSAGAAEIDILEQRHVVRLIAEIALIVVLFTDSSQVRVRIFRQTWHYAKPMLLVGLPLTVALGTATVLFLNPAMGVSAALLIAALLSPTDAALGQTVVTSPDVPEHLSKTISIESGLNDGLAYPFVLLGALLVSVGAGSETDGLAFHALKEVILAPVAGIAVGWTAAKLINLAHARGTMEESASGVVVLSAAFSSYLFSLAIGGNGFIAAFIGGMAFGNTLRVDRDYAKEFLESFGQILTMTAFLLFGLVMLPESLAVLDFDSLIFALLFLTVIRMLPVYLSLTGSGLSARERLFLGWFGPRGLASILFALIVTESFKFEGQNLLLSYVGITVFLSVILHGVSAMPLAKWIGKKAVPKG